MSVDPITNEALAALLAGATPGPWDWLTKAGAGEYYLYGGDACTGIKDDGATTEDLDLAALTPALAAEVLALRARVAELEGRTVPELPDGWVEHKPTHFEGPTVRLALVGDGVCVMSRGRTEVIPRAVLLRVMESPDVP